jgi:hypothetical protein
MVSAIEDVGGRRGDHRRMVVRRGSGWPTGGGWDRRGGAMEAGGGEEEKADGERAEAVARGR